MKHGWKAALIAAMAIAAEGEDIDQLLESYRIESDLSKITKKETAGVIELFTRDMLEKMQAHTLSDVLKNITVLNYTRTPRGITLFSKSSVGFVPIPSVRLYINDHDMTSASFGSALLIWGDMPVEQIDHIEVYKGASSIEFGNETGSIIIRLYTKSPKRDEGGKLRLMADDSGSYEVHAYYAYSGEDDLQLFVYGEKDDIRRETFDWFDTVANNDKEGHMAQLTLLKKGYRLDAGYYAKEMGEFLGESPPYRPNGGKLKAHHGYLHAVYEADNGLKLTAAYDDLAYRRQGTKALDRTYAFPVVNRFVSEYSDRVLTLQAEKGFDWEDWHLFAGAFYKYKAFDADTAFGFTHMPAPIEDEYGSGLNLYSVYAESRYDVDDFNALILSAKWDSHHYTGGIEDYDEWILRGGYLSKPGEWTLKLFATRGYLPASMYQLNGGDHNLIGGNPALKPMKIDLLLTADIQWRHGRHTLDWQVAYTHTSDRIVYRPDRGYVNLDATSNYRRGVMRYTYHWNVADFTRVSWYGGASVPGVHLSPDYGILLESYNAFGRFDLYNALHIRGPYTLGEASVDTSYDYTLAIRYRYDDSLSIGIRGENLFDKGFEQAYADIGATAVVPVYDRKIWLNLEYQF